MQIKANYYGLYELYYVGFGKMSFEGSPSVPADGFFEFLGYTHQAQAAQIATNFRGLGLPEYLWLQFVDLFYKVDANMNSELVCYQEVDGKCHLPNNCAAYSGLWS